MLNKAYQGLLQHLMACLHATHIFTPQGSQGEVSAYERWGQENYIAVTHVRSLSAQPYNLCPSTPKTFHPQWQGGRNWNLWTIPRSGDKLGGGDRCTPRCFCWAPFVGPTSVISISWPAWSLGQRSESSRRESGLSAARHGHGSF